MDGAVAGVELAERLTVSTALLRPGDLVCGIGTVVSVEPAEPSPYGRQRSRVVLDGQGEQVWLNDLSWVVERPPAFPTPAEHAAGAGETVDLDAEEREAIDATFDVLAGITDMLREHNPEALDAEPLMRWFDYKHLPADLAAVSGLFGAIAGSVTVVLPRTPERTVALRKLLEAKDAAVRCALEARDGAL